MSWSKLLAAALAATPIPLASQAAAAGPAPTVKAMTFQDVDGHPVTLAAVVGDRPTLLVFLRHFG